MPDDAPYGDPPPSAVAALTALLDRDDPTVIGIVLSGSAARGLATPHSDVDVIVVRDGAGDDLEVTRSAAIDEIPMTLAELERISPVGSAGAWARWSFAWARVLRDTPDGRIQQAVTRQAVLDEAEVRALLLGDSRLDEYLNFSYRALKSHRDGRADAARMDSAEGLASLLDVIFALSGRVRPYNKYLAWELETHPLPDPAWRADTLLPMITGLLDGDEATVRSALAALEAACRAEHRLGAELGAVFDHWGPDELALMRGTQPR